MDSSRVIEKATPQTHYVCAPISIRFPPSLMDMKSRATAAELQN